jgi:hypothetical protein
MGFSLTEEPNEILCPKDVREGKGSDRFLAPAISRFVTNTLAGIGGGAAWDQQAQDVWRELVHLHQRWGKISKATEDDNIRAQACNDANESGQFTRISQRKNLPWEKDSIAKVAYDPALAMFRPRSESTFSLTSHPKRGEWTGVPPSNQEVLVVAA